MTGKELKQFRLKHNLSQSQLAVIVGVKTNTVSKWESGIRNIGQSAIVILENYPNFSQESKEPEEVSTKKSSSMEELLSNALIEKLQPLIKEATGNRSLVIDNSKAILELIQHLILDVDELKDHVEELKEEIDKVRDQVFKIPTQ